MSNDNQNKKHSVHAIYSLCRHFQARQEKGSDLNGKEVAELNNQIEHEMALHNARLVNQFKSEHKTDA